MTVAGPRRPPCRRLRRRDERSSTSRAISTRRPRPTPSACPSPSTSSGGAPSSAAIPHPLRVHYILAGEVAPQTIGEIGEAISRASRASRSSRNLRPIRAPYGDLWSIFVEVAKHGGMMAVHAEEDDVVTYMTEKAQTRRAGAGLQLRPRAQRHLPGLAFRVNIIRLAQHTGNGVYFVHTTAKEGVAAVAEARRLGQPVRRGPASLHLDSTCDDYRKPGGTAIHTVGIAIKFADDRDERHRPGLLDGGRSAMTRRPTNTLCTRRTSWPAARSRPCARTQRDRRRACRGVHESSSPSGRCR